MSFYYVKKQHNAFPTETGSIILTILSSVSWTGLRLHTQEDLSTFGSWQYGLQQLPEWFRNHMYEKLKNLFFYTQITQTFLDMLFACYPWILTSILHTAWCCLCICRLTGNTPVQIHNHHNSVPDNDKPLTINKTLAQ